jgi:hypothetical protein
MAIVGTPSISLMTSVIVLITWCGTGREPTSVVPSRTHCMPGRSGCQGFVLVLGSTKLAGSNSVRSNSSTLRSPSPPASPPQPASASARHATTTAGRTPRRSCDAMRFPPEFTLPGITPGPFLEFDHGAASMGCAGPNPL